jgi:hypothetical protein
MSIEQAQEVNPMLQRTALQRESTEVEISLLKDIEKLTTQNQSQNSLLLINRYLDSDSCYYYY